LLVDEVLAVGDAEFQKKCLGKMDEVAKGGRTVVFVSHNMGAVKELCKKGLLIKNKQSTSYNSINLLLEKYSTIKVDTSKFTFHGPLSPFIRLKDVKINYKSVFCNEILVSQTEKITIEIHLNILKQLLPFRATLSIYNTQERLFSLHDMPPTFSPIGNIICYYEIPSHLLRPDIYRVGLGGLISDENSDWYWNDSVCNFRVLDIWDEKIEIVNHGAINVHAKTYRQTL
jgi:lipopolysaccharide transport system ATP-binding protein